MTVELPTCFLVNVYVPNAGAGLVRLDYRTQAWDAAFASYLRGLQSGAGVKSGVGKPVVLTGDLNCAHTELDIHNAKGNLKSAGFTPEERESFASKLLCAERGLGLVDAFRAQHGPGVVAYTYWDYRSGGACAGSGEEGLAWYLLPAPSMAGL